MCNHTEFVQNKRKIAVERGFIPTDFSLGIQLLAEDTVEGIYSVSLSVAFWYVLCRFRGPRLFTKEQFQADVDNIERGV